MLISVIIPCYNVENYIAQAIKSVLAQTHPTIELILVDNNSTDGTMAILEVFEEEYPNIIKVFTQPLPGAPAARNLGLWKSKGEWIQFLDADDLMLPDKLERQAAMARPYIPMIVGMPRYQLLDGETFSIEPWDDPFMGIFDGLSQGNTCANLWNRSFLKHIGGWDEDQKFQQDYDLIYRLLKVNDQPVLDKTISVIIRERPSGQITTKDPRGIRIAILDLRIRILNYLKETRPDYFLDNQFFYYQTFYRFIRFLAEVDLQLAETYFKKVLPKDFKPRYSKETYIPLWNSMMVNLVGFKQAEEFKNIVKKTLGRE